MMSGTKGRRSTYEKKIPVQIIRGFPFPALPCFLKRNIESAISHTPNDSDVIISTYPTAIDSWMVALIYKILNYCLPTCSGVFVHPIVHDLERLGTATLEQSGASSKPRLLRIHTPYQLTPKNSSAKYIYMMRNPKGVVLSYYLYYKTMPMNGFRGSFADFFDSFVAGELPYGDYFDHIRSWNAHRQDSNVLVLSYEQMHANPRTQLLMLARFFGPQYSYQLANNPESLENILDYPFQMYGMNTPCFNTQNATQASPPALQSSYPYWYGDGVLSAWSKCMTLRQELILDKMTIQKLGAAMEQWKVWEL